MHTGKSYKLSEFLLWTRRSIFWLLLYGTIPTILYQVFDIKWLSIPWPVVALLGTATAFIVGFKNVQTYNRTWEARQIWGGCDGRQQGLGNDVPRLHWGYRQGQKDHISPFCLAYCFALPATSPQELGSS